jgi:Methyltransferase domain
MKLRITKKDGALILIASILLLVVAVTGWLLLGEAALIILPVLSGILILVVVLEMYRRLSAELSEKDQNQEYQRNQDYRQIESFLSLFFTLKPSLPLPDTRGWAASPDLLKKITEVILIEKPSLVIEASSGVSTLVIAYCLKKLGKGKVVSLEHDAKYAAISQSLISFHGLEDIATIVYAPLKGFESNDQRWLWYNTDRLKIDQPIDLLVVDGPPGNIQKLSRYPALPLLYRHLNNKSTIILDDGHREDEKKIVALWEKEFSHISSEFLDMERGAYLIHKNDQAEGA